MSAILPAVNPLERVPEWLHADIVRTCVRHGVSVAEVFGPCIRRRVVAARHLIWFDLYEAGLSYPDIGELFDRDHTSVVLAVRKVATLLGLCSWRSRPSGRKERADPTSMSEVH